IHAADARVCADIARDAQSTEEGGLSKERFAGGGDLARRTVVDDQRADSITARFSGQLQTAVRIRDASCEKKLQRRLEVVGVLDKERPLFGKENLEAPIHRLLRLVGLDLAEVRIHRDV